MLWMLVLKPSGIQIELWLKKIMYETDTESVQ